MFCTVFVFSLNNHCDSIDGSRNKQTERERERQKKYNTNNTFDRLFTWFRLDRVQAQNKSCDRTNHTVKMNAFNERKVARHLILTSEHTFYTLTATSLSYIHATYETKIYSHF